MRIGFSNFFGNPLDWDRFHALEAGEDVGPPLVSDHQIWRDELELAVLGDELGFDTFWTQEQHAAPYLMIPDAHMLIAYLIGRTKNLDFGSSITVLPWHNPFRVAEQISLIQHMLGPDRKYYFGVGRGSAARNFDAMNVDMEQSRELFNESLDIIQLAFTKEIFSYEGKFWKYHNASLRPRPLDASTVIEAFGAWTSNASLVNMAERGLHPLTSPNTTIESYIEEQKEFNKVRIDKGFGPAIGPVIKVPLMCAQSEAEATEKAEEYFSTHVQSVINMYQVGGEKFGTVKGYEAYRTQKGSDFGDGTVESALYTLTKKFLEQGIIGTPQQCIEKSIETFKAINCSELCVMTVVGNEPFDVSEKSMRLFAEQVMPAVRQATDSLEKSGA